jgi:hypothetical protein
MLLRQLFRVTQSTHAWCGLNRRPGQACHSQRLVAVKRPSSQEHGEVLSVLGAACLWASHLLPWFAAVGTYRWGRGALLILLKHGT